MTDTYVEEVIRSGVPMSTTRTLLPLTILFSVWTGSVVAYAWSGFNVTDDGFILAQATRVLSGGVPHVDIISVRPLGSPLLHTIDLLLPTPLFLTSRSIVLLQLLVTAAIIVRLLVSKALRNWGFAETALTVISFLVSLHTFPLMAWHTVDGLMVTAVALLFLDRGCREVSVRLILLGSVIAGYAPLVKQSFFAVPLVALVWVFWRFRAQKGGDCSLSARRVALAMCAMVIPGGTYVVWVASFSGLGAARTQLVGAQAVEWLAVIKVERSPQGLGILALASAGIAVSLLLVVLRKRRALETSQPAALDLVSRSAVAAVACFLPAAAVVTVLDGRLSLEGDWGKALWLLAVASMVLVSTAQGELDVPGGAVLASAWMSSLSWGYPVPNVMAGSLLAVILVRSASVVGQFTAERWKPLLRVTDHGVLALLLALAALLSFQCRSAEVYRDAPTRNQTAQLGDISALTRGITTNPVTYQYLREIQDCLESHPASRLAVLPDNAVVPLLFDRENPLPLDWWYPPEIPSDRSGLISAVRRVDAQGDYLVLFQSVQGIEFSNLELLPSVDGDTRAWDYSRGMSGEIFSVLTGEPVSCGSFVGKHRPAS